MNRFNAGKVYRAVRYDFGDEKKLPRTLRIKYRKEVLRFWENDSVYVMEIKESGWLLAYNLNFPQRRSGLIHSTCLDVHSEKEIPSFNSKSTYTNISEGDSNGYGHYEEMENLYGDGVDQQEERWDKKPIPPDTLLKPLQEIEGDPYGGIVSCDKDDLLECIEQVTQDGKIKVRNIKNGQQGYAYACDVLPFCSQRWFYGKMSRLYVELIFENASEGMFLVWQANNIRYVITVMLDKSQLKHFVILQQEDGLYLDKTNHESFFSILKALRSAEMPMKIPLKVPSAFCGCLNGNIEMPTEREADIIYVLTQDARLFVNQTELQVQTGDLIRKCGFCTTCELTIVKRLNDSRFGLMKSIKCKEGFQERWYAGNTSFQEVEQLLSGKENGSFLVFNSEKPIGQYVIAIKAFSDIEYLQVEEIDENLSFEYNNTYHDCSTLCEVVRVLLALKKIIEPSEAIYDEIWEKILAEKQQNITKIDHMMWRRGKKESGSDCSAYYRPLPQLPLYENVKDAESLNCDNSCVHEDCNTFTEPLYAIPTREPSIQDPPKPIPRPRNMSTSTLPRQGSNNTDLRPKPRPRASTVNAPSLRRKVSNNTDPEYSNNNSENKTQDFKNASTVLKKLKEIDINDSEHQNINAKEEEKKTINNHEVEYYEIPPQENVPRTCEVKLRDLGDRERKHLCNQLDQSEDCERLAHYLQDKIHLTPIEIENLSFAGKNPALDFFKVFKKKHIKFTVETFKVYLEEMGREDILEYMNEHEWPDLFVDIQYFELEKISLYLNIPPSNWEKLALKWNYSSNDISSIKAASMRGQKSAADHLLTTITRRCRNFTVHNLRQAFTQIRRYDLVDFLDELPFATERH